MSSGLAAGFLLDQQWHWLRNERETTKKSALMALVRVLDSANMAYAIIGGAAVQTYVVDHEPKRLGYSTRLSLRRPLPTVETLT